MSNYQSSFHVIDLKIDIAPSLVHCRCHRHNACSPASSAVACCYTMEHSDEYLCTGGSWGLPYTYTTVSKQADAFWVHSTFRTCSNKSGLARFPPNFRSPLIPILSILEGQKTLLIHLDTIHQVFLGRYPWRVPSMSTNITYITWPHLNRLYVQHVQTITVCSYSVSQKKSPPWDFLAFFPKRLGIFSPNFTRLLDVPIYARLQIFIQLSPTLTKLCHIKCDHLACVSADGGHFEHMMVVALNMA